MKAFLARVPRPLLYMSAAGVYLGATTLGYYAFSNSVTGDKNKNNSNNGSGSDSSGSGMKPIVVGLGGGVGCGCVHVTDKEREATYASIAPKYDQEIGMDEVFMGISLVRWWLLKKATGNVLEIGCGTGRNFSFYSDEVKKLVVTDTVMPMIEVAKKKVTPNPHPFKIEFFKMDSHSLGFESGQFDTVVDTFGLCSYEDPVGVLKEMARVCKQDGKILLIEHGKGSYDWINKIINDGADQHAQNWGCVWNKDIEGIVRQAGLEIIDIKRLHFGTTYVVEATPGKTK